MEEFSIPEINGRAKVDKEKHLISTLQCFLMLLSFLVLTSSQRCFYFTTANRTPTGIANASNILVLFTNGIAKMFLKAMGSNKYKHRKNTLLARGKLNSIEKNILKAECSGRMRNEVWKTKQKYNICWDNKTMLSYCLKCRKKQVKAQKKKRLRWKNHVIVQVCNLWQQKSPNSSNSKTPPTCWAETGFIYSAFGLSTKNKTQNKNNK